MENDPNRPDWVDRILDKLGVFGRALQAQHELRAIVLEPPLPLEDIEAFEHAHGVRLPEAYRDFLRFIGRSGRGPNNGLIPLAAPDFSSFGPMAASITTIEGEHHEVTVGPKSACEQPAKLSEPFLAPPVPSDKNLYDGCLPISQVAGGYFELLVVAGPHAGEVWADFTATNGGLCATGVDFVGWYEAWLDASIRQRHALDVRRALEAKERSSIHDDIARFFALHLDDEDQTYAVVNRGLVEHYLGRREDAAATLGRAEIIDRNNPLLNPLRELVHAAAFADARATEQPRLLSAMHHPLREVRKVVAENPLTPEALLVELAGDREHWVRRMVARHVDCGSRALEALIQGAVRRFADAPEESFFELDLALRRKEAPGDAVRAFREASQPIPAHPLSSWLARAAAINPTLTTDELFRTLDANQDAPWVRHAIAHHPAVTPSILESLAEDPHATVRAQAALSPKTPLLSLVTLLSDGDEDVRTVAVRNPAIPPHLFVTCALERSHAVVFQLLHNKRIPNELRRVLEAHPAAINLKIDLAKEPPPHRLTHHPTLNALDVVSARGVGHASHPRPMLGRLVDDPQVLVSYEMALYPWLDRDLFVRLAHHPYAYTRARIAAHPEVPADVLLELSRDPEPMVRASAVSNANLGVERALELARDPSYEGRMSAASHPKLPREVLAALAKDEHPRVRQQAGMNGSTPIEALDALAKDSDVYVRRWLVLHPRLPGAILHKLAQDPDEETRRRAEWRRTADALMSSATS
jgi:hypothetical protein